MVEWFKSQVLKFHFREHRFFSEMKKTPALQGYLTRIANNISRRKRQ
jgi:hypothetical protein